MLVMWIDDYHCKKRIQFKRGKLEKSSIDENQVSLIWNGGDVIAWLASSL